MMSWYWFPPLFVHFSYFFSCSLTHTWSVIITPNHHSSLIQLGLDWVCCFDTTHTEEESKNYISYLSNSSSSSFVIHNRYRKHLKSHHHFSLHRINWIKRSFHQSFSLDEKLSLISRIQKSVPIINVKRNKGKISTLTHIYFSYFTFHTFHTFHTHQNHLQYLPACNPCLNPNFVLPESPVSLNHHYYKV